MRALPGDEFGAVLNEAEAGLLISEAILAWFTRELRSTYSKTLHEPIPEHLMAIIERLDRRGGAG